MHCYLKTSIRIEISTYKHIKAQIIKKVRDFIELNFRLQEILRYSLQTTAIIDVKVAYFGHKTLHKSAV